MSRVGSRVLEYPACSKHLHKLDANDKFELVPDLTLIIVRSSKISCSNIMFSQEKYDMDIGSVYYIYIVCVFLQFACCGSEHISDFEKNATHWSKTNRIRERLRARVPLMCCRLSPDSPTTLESARFVDVDGCMDHTRSRATNLQVGDKGFGEKMRQLDWRVVFICATL